MKNNILSKLVVFLLVLTCLFSATAFAEGKLKVTTKNLIVFFGDDSGYFYAKVENVGDKPIGADSGDLVIFTADDEILFTDQYITTLPSYVVLESGDYLYIKEFLWNSSLENAEIGDYKISIPVRKSSSTITKVACESSFDIKGANSYDNYVYITFTNTTDKTLYDFYFVGALYDAEGNLIFVDSDSLGSVAVHSGSTVTARLYIDAKLMKHYAMNDIVPATVDGMVCYSNE